MGLAADATGRMLGGAPGFLLKHEIAGGGGQANQRFDDLAGCRRNSLVDIAPDPDRHVGAVGGGQVVPGFPGVLMPLVELFDEVAGAIDIA